MQHVRLQRGNVCSAAIGGTLQYGYNIAIINAPTTYIQRFINETFQERWGADLQVYQVTLIWTFIVSFFSLGGLAGALIAGPMAIHFGRKKSLLLNNVFLLLGSVLAVSSRVARSFEMIILARLLVGINAGVSMNVQPMYFGESAPKHLRGAVTISSAVFTAFGVVLGQVVGLREILGSESCWPYLLASNAVPGLIQLLTLPWFPESPRYLLIDKGDKEACIKALSRFRGCDVLHSEIEEMQQEQAAAMGMKARGPWELLTDRSLRWQLLSVMVISSAMQLCGNDAIYFYASYVFQEAGISTETIQYVTIGTGSCEFTASIFSNLLIEKLGRKFLLVGGYILMACWAVIFTVGLSFEHVVSWMPYLSMTSVFAYILSFGTGPAGVTGILPTEVFSQTARPAAYMLAGSMMWINLFLMGMLFPFIVRGLGQFCFLPFGAVCLLSAIFIGLVLPETKGKSVAAITEEYDKLNFRGQERQLSVLTQPPQYQLGKVLSSTSL
ncbi:solute carrier family 2, facilitated glucose transporter member 11 isoform X2 [Conger conger]|uniref:solute carrier family 2, facilitated glucose transporter member 11 isoform X2 n=1 Tax=Conger conger TaxID=82655 RepID=UPI002A59A05E|nr:solute carrier family 2, facilitated glucose transporter member 11 isoform X2 [Conger conger]